MTFGAPLVLIGLAPLTAAAPWLLRRDRVVGALRLAVLALLVLAIAEPRVGGAAAPPTVVVLDRSASVDPSMTATERSWARAAGEAGCTKPCQVVTFAGDARLAPAAEATSWTPPATNATDVEAGVRLATGAAGPGGRVVLIGDGFATSGDATAAAAAARAHNVHVDVVPLRPRPNPDVAVTRLRAPAAVHAGDPLPLDLTVRSATAGTATLALIRDGRATGSQALTVKAGDNPFVLDLRAPGPGWHAYRVTATIRGDRRPANDALTATTRVARRPTALIVTAGTPPPAAFAAMLRRRGFTVRTGTPRAVAAASAQDIVVLDDVPRPALAAGEVAALGQAVGRGTGLLVLGGGHSLSLGRYAHSRLERLLPVTSLVPGSRQRRTVALELVLDRSASMNDLGGDVPKIDMARAAGQVAATYATQHEDELGVVSFDIRPRTLIGIERVTKGPTADSAQAQIAGLQADGGTDIYLGLKSGIAQIERSHAPNKHLILMSDGVSEPRRYGALVARLRRDRVTLTTIALGPGADRRLLHTLAVQAHGRFYYTANARDLPRIFAREARLSVRPVRTRGTIAVQAGADSPAIAGLAGQRLPALHGNVITTLKPTAQADLLALGRKGERDPALAQWQYGLGRVLVWTPGIGTSWAAAWAGGEDRFWDGALRFVERAVPTPALQPRLPQDGSPRAQIDPLDTAGRTLDLATLTGTATPPGGSPKPVRFAEVGPSRYEAALPGGRPGVWRVAVARGPNALLAVPYPSELRPRPAADSVLGPLAALTGGRVLDPAHPDRLRPAGRIELWWPLALAALAGFVVHVLIRLSRAVPKGSPT